MRGAVMVTYLHFDKLGRGCVIRRVASGAPVGGHVARFESFTPSDKVLAASLQQFLRELNRPVRDKGPEAP